ncbi:DUF349 domain-containing protein [Caldichromatium japonicum]|uniref:DUF349 domain-containing protein n=1 Tax=Caldichromatium japonicum TaxID=2699430 RepID=A0A6G7VDR4_9GAMM|nr:DUF349 domain-containing protein [Caldichromatium japonicum]QIK38161.1 DUF349 domain-containing protein [Caldichromatium japonicum]
MLFQRLLKGRKSPAEVTGSQVAAPSSPTKPAPSPGHLIEQALHDHDPARRLAAIAQLNELEILVRLGGKDSPPEVRTAAVARLLDCLCQPHSDLPGNWHELLGQIQEGSQLARLAHSAHDPRVRRAAIECITDPETLATCAIQDASPANRWAALERIEDQSVLEKVVRGIGKRDKRVYRLAREKLRLIAERAERPRLVRQRCEELCAQAERLGRLGQWNQDRALLDYLDRQWAMIQDEAEPEWRERFDHERARFLEAYAAHLNAQSTAAVLAPIADKTETTPAANSDQSTTATHPAANEGHGDPESATQSQTATEGPQLPAKQGDQPIPGIETLIRLTAQAERLLYASKPLDHKQVQRLLERGRARIGQWPDTEQAHTFQRYAERLEGRLRTQRRHAEQRLRQFSDRLAELEDHLQDGELKKADPLFQSLTAALELIRISGIDAASIAEFEQRLRLLAPRLRELQNWRRWGGDQHRENLCTEMEALIDQEIPLEVLTERLHRLQMDWKRIDRTGAPVNQALWERFHAASERVYARCRPFMEAQAEEREANRLAREQICERIEDFLAKVDWERVDWKKTLQAERELRQAWAAIGPTEGRIRRALERRFYQSLRLLDRHLDAERERNQVEKRELIARVQALIEHPDLEEAIAQTKALQRQWQTTVPGRQRDENRLWHAFRSACDAVFARRTAQQQVQAQEQARQLALLDSICAEAEQIAATEQDCKRLAAAQRELNTRWYEATESLTLARPASAAIHRRWNACRQALERQRQTLEQRQRQTELEQFAKRAALCERIEQAALKGEETALDTQNLRQEWAELPTLQEARLANALAARFERALAALADETARSELCRAAAGNAPRRAELCLQLEIAAGVETPPELADQRLRLQVARLAERLGERESGLQPRGLDLLVDWYLLGPAPQDQGLEQRFERAKAALLAEHPTVTDRSG